MYQDGWIERIKNFQFQSTTQSQMRFKGNIKLKRLFIENVTMVTLTQPLKLTNNHLPKALIWHCKNQNRQQYYQFCTLKKSERLFYSSCFKFYVFFVYLAFTNQQQPNIFIFFNARLLGNVNLIKLSNKLHLQSLGVPTHLPITTLLGTVVL